MAPNVNDLNTAKKCKGLSDSRWAKAEESTPHTKARPTKSLIGDLSVEEKKCRVINPAMRPGVVGLAGSRWATKENPPAEPKSIIGDLSPDEKRCKVENPAMRPGVVGLAGSRWAK